jgi:V-type H+-transporting ATPase subunit C
MRLDLTPTTEPLEQYLSNFQWNKVKYRSDKPIAELISLLQKVAPPAFPIQPISKTNHHIQEVNSIDNDVRSKFNQYNTLRTNLATLHRKQSGNLATKSLLSIVNPSMLVQTSGSEHLETHLVAVPSSSAKDFTRSYETLSPMVVPRSASLIDSDSEYNLYAVTVFKKHAQEFVHKAREQKWVPRDFKAQEGGKEAEVKELRKAEQEEKRVWGEILRLGRTGWSEGVMCLVHVVVLRIFVETVLRYGLPLDYVAAVVKVSFASL